MPDQWPDALDFVTLRQLYLSHSLAPVDLVAGLFRRIRTGCHPNVWITLLEETNVLAAARALQTAAAVRGMTEFPLFGIPFAVKDNIDVAGIPTTAACREFAYTPEKSSPVVEKLLAAGAILLGKTNLDQFATGLTGVLSPYGAPRNVFNADYVSGGSSSGSAVAVAAGFVSFALGTDTAGSGRVPAAFNHIVGLKPTRGVVSTRGVVPACRSLDVVSFLTLNVSDAEELLALAKGFDGGDPFSRREADTLDLGPPDFPDKTLRFGIPRQGQIDFSPDQPAGEMFSEAVKNLEALGGQRFAVDIGPFLETGKLLYEGPWIAERLASVDAFHAERAEAFLPVTHGIIARGRSRTAADAFKAIHRLKELARQTEAQWAMMDVLVLPTAVGLPTFGEAQADPAAASARLGLFTNFVNLLDLCALAVPAGFRPDGLPFGITFIGPAFSENKLLALGRRFFPAQFGGLHHRAVVTKSTVSSITPTAHSSIFFPRHPPRMQLCVVGAHLSGQPLNHQLTELGGILVRQCKTMPVYRLYALAGTTPPKPGLAHVPTGESGTAIEVEVWSLPESAVGKFMAKVPSPMCIGTITLDNGEIVKGFLCEPHALVTAKDITSFGGWLRYLERASA